MSFKVVVIALIWGVAAGYLALRAIECLLGVGFCLHGLLLGRWKRLEKKAAVGVVAPKIILPLMVRLGLYTVAFGALLQIGSGLVRQEFRFDYGGSDAIVFAVCAAATALSRLPSSRKRLGVIWKMSHQHDYAQKRQRTRILKS